MLKKFENYIKLVESKIDVPTIVSDSIVTIKVKYFDFNYNIKDGEIECNKNIADDLVSIFKEILKINFPIDKIYPISKYNYDDMESVKDNNTSCFNYRFVIGSSKISDHATGNAIDINPFQNPWVHPNAHKIPGRKYDPEQIGTITKEVVDIFKSYGWGWGGDWKNPDYQHFYKPDNILKDKLLLLNEEYNELDPYGEDEGRTISDYYNILKELKFVNDLRQSKDISKDDVILFTINVYGMPINFILGSSYGEFTLCCPKAMRYQKLIFGTKEELLNKIDFLKARIKLKDVLKKVFFNNESSTFNELDPYGEEDWEERKTKIEIYRDMLEGSRGVSDVKLYRPPYLDKADRVYFNFNSNYGISKFVMYDNNKKQPVLKLGNTNYAEILKEETEEELMNKIWSLLEEEEKNKKNKPHIYLSPTDKNKFRLVKKFNEHYHELDPYGEDNWEDDDILSMEGFFKEFCKIDDAYVELVTDDPIYDQRLKIIMNFTKPENRFELFLIKRTGHFYLGFKTGNHRCMAHLNKYDNEYIMSVIRTLYGERNNILKYYKS